MVAIKENFGVGGANLAPSGAQGSPDLATALRDIADDLAAVKDLVNDLKAKYNALVDLVNEIKADYNAHCAAAGLHYDGTASVTDTTNTVSTADGEKTTVPDVTPKTVKA